MEWDTDSFTRTARAVLILNPRIKERYPDVESVVSFMRHIVMTDIVPRNGTMCGTCGFDLVICYRPNRAPWVRAAISNILLEEIESLARGVSARDLGN